MKPSIGRIIHFVDTNGICRAAIITRVGDQDNVDLHIFGDHQQLSSLVYDISLLDEKTKKAETWHWPERVE